jgi:o-succinylbenzoate synthase
VCAAATIDEPLVVAIPLTTPFRGTRVREAALWRGPAGWCEFAPFGDYDDAAAVPWLRAAEAFAREPAPAPVRTSVAVNCTVPAVAPDEAAAIVTAGHGCTTAKVKVAEAGQSLDDDLARVAAVRDALGQHGRVRIDANGGWTVAQARVALRELGPFDLEYVEQPCRSVEELAQVRSLGLALVAADESIRLASDPLRVVRAGACDVAVVKVAPLGGVLAALRIAEDVDVPVVVSSAVDTSIGLSAGVALAACLPDLPYACGLGTRELLTADVVADSASLAPRAGVVPVARPDVDEAAAAAVAADPVTSRRFRDRLARVRTLAGVHRA